MDIIKVLQILTKRFFLLQLKYQQNFNIYFINISMHDGKTCFEMHSFFIINYNKVFTPEFLDFDSNQKTKNNLLCIP